MRKVAAGAGPRGRACQVLTVSAIRRSASIGTLSCGNMRVPCALGRGGRRVSKREGDGATPVGTFPIRAILYRPDRMPRPHAGLPARPLRPWDGWCDDPADRNYNRAVRHPYPAGAELMWRRDHLYDCVVVLGYNLRPRVRGLGSAIFMHLAAPGYAPTAGCIALSRRHMRMVLARLSPGAVVRVVA